jgi:hypothetical protein
VTHARADTPGTVLTFGGDLPSGGHERATHAAVARELAALLRYRFGGDVDPVAQPRSPCYLVPSETLSREHAAALRVQGGADLFGGVVPHAFVGTKSITHPLVPDARHAPAGWSAAFAERVHGDVLAGYAAFHPDDVRVAVRRLLPRGPVRLKLATGIGGVGQWLLADEAQADTVIGDLDAPTLATHGCVIEEHLESVTTVSFGRVDVAGLVATYCGQQRLTRGRHGNEVYGGSDLLVVRGGVEALLRLPLAPGLHTAIEQACRYDAAADACFPGFFASRRNYDVAQGIDSEGAPRSGVLEQSWRIGGASGAEVAALTAFAADPALQVVRARTVEIHGEAEVPKDARVLYRGTDRRVGHLIKYVLTQPYADT